MKSFFLVSLFGSIVLLAVWKLDFAPVNSWLGGVSSPGKTELVQAPPTMTLAKLNELVSIRVSMTTLLTGENDWYKGIWAIEGDALFATDCSQAKWDVDQQLKHVTLTLPEPRPIVCRVNHERSRLHDFRSHSWNPAQLIWGDPDELRDNAMKHAQQKLGEEAQQHDFVRQATESAEGNLRRFYDPVGYRLTVDWRPHLEIP